MYVKYLTLYVEFNKITINNTQYYHDDDGGDYDDNDAAATDGKQDKHQGRPEKWRKGNENNNYNAA